MVRPQETEDFVALFSKGQQRVYAFILTLVPNWAEAEDVMQETNLVMWRKRSQFQPGTDFVRWGCQIAFFEVLKFRKRQKHDRLIFSDAFLSAVAEDTLALVDSLEVERNALSDCRKKLSLRDRDLLDRRYQPGATTKGVAAEVNRSVDAVYKALQRIRAALLSCVRRALAMEGRS